MDGTHDFPEPFAPRQRAADTERGTGCMVLLLGVIAAFAIYGFLNFCILALQVCGVLQLP